MSDIAIRVENLGKMYHIGRAQQRHDTLRDLIVDTAAHIKDWGKRGDKSDETIWALKDVSFDVKRGEVVGIIGRNGAGKSTLLKILSRITEPTTGRAEIHGRVGSLLEVGTGFHPELTGRENIYLNGAILGMHRAEIDKKFDEIVAFAEIEKFLDTPVKRYSSGMYVRLAFAVAAHLEPEILLVDEVLAVGDAAFQKKCLGKMGEVAKEGRTVLFVSHNMAAVQQLCGEVLLLVRGHVDTAGLAEVVIRRYLSDASEAQDGVFRLESHSARMRRYEPIIKQLRLIGSDRCQTATYYPEDAFQVEITMEPSVCIREPRVAIAIEDSLGRRIMTMASYFQDSCLPTIEGRTLVICSLPRLGLGSGRYLLSVSVGTKMEGLLDSIDGAMWFEVNWNNNYGNGEPYIPVYGPVLTQSSWRVAG